MLSRNKKAMHNRLCMAFFLGINISFVLQPQQEFFWLTRADTYKA
jgi:hypothetical protein